VAAGGGDLQRALGVLLALHFAQVGDAFAVDHRAGAGRRQRLDAAEMVHERDQRRRRDQPGVARPRGFRAAGLRTDQAQAHAAGGHRRGQAAGDRHDAAVQRQLPQPRPAVEGVGRDHAHAGHHGQGDRQVVVAAHLRQVGRGQVGDDPLARPRQPHAHEGGPDALAALGHRLVAETDDDEGAVAAGELDLDVDANRVHALERDRHHPRRHAFSPPPRQTLSTGGRDPHRRSENEIRTDGETYKAKLELAHS
jgi:hypothetical protein